MATNNMINTPEPFSLASGGSGADLTAVQGALVYSTVSAMAFTAAGNSGQIMQSAGTSEPAWTTATYPGTAGTQYNVLQSTGTNITSATLTSVIDGAIGSTQGDVLYRNSTVWTVLAPGTAGQVFTTGGSSANPSWSNVSGGGFVWSTIAGSTLNAAVGNGYIINDTSAQCVITLPATAVLGASIRVIGLSTGMGWQITANTGQTIQFGNVSSTSGGSWTSAAATDSCLLTCIVANTTWALSDCVSAGLTKA